MFNNYSISNASKLSGISTSVLNKRWKNLIQLYKNKSKELYPEILDILTKTDNKYPNKL